jgi:hypothetical protein
MAIFVVIKKLPVDGLAMWPFIFFKNPDYKYNKFIINHEKIHIKQQIEMGILPFYLLYLLEWVFRRFKHKNWHQAYMNISFEREAYTNDLKPNYLKKRKFWSWTKYF